MFVFSFNSVSSAREISDFSKPATVFEMPPPWPDLVRSGAAAVGRISALLRKVLSMSDPTLAAGSSALVCAVTSLLSLCQCRSALVCATACSFSSSSFVFPRFAFHARFSPSRDRCHARAPRSACWGGLFWVHGVCLSQDLSRSFSSSAAFFILFLFLLRWVGALCGYSPGCLRVRVCV